MRLATTVLLLLACLGTAVTAEASVVVHGLSHDALGAATLVSSTGSDGKRRIEVRGIGSSGQDGVAVSLARCNGYSMVFGPPDLLPALPMDQCRLKLKALIGGTTSVVCTWEKVDNTLSSVTEHHLDASGASTATVEVWHGSDLQCCVSKPSSIVVTTPIDPLGVCADGSVLSAYADRRRDENVLHRQLVLVSKLRSSTTVTVDGMSFIGDAIVYRCDVGQTPLNFTDAQCTVRCPGGGGGGGGAGGAVYVTAEQLVVDPPSKSGVPQLSQCFVEGEGVVLLQGPTPGTLTSDTDGSGDAPAIRLNGLPPGEPWVWGRSHVDVTLSSLPASSSSAIQITCPWDMQDGLPETDITTTLTWTKDASSNVMWNVDATGPIVSKMALYSSGQVLTISGTNFAFSGSRNPDRSYVNCANGECRVGMPLGAGASMTLDGAVYVADSAVLVIGGDLPVARRISDVRIVHPPGTPPGTWRQLLACGSVPSSVYVPIGGLALFGRGPRQTVSLDGTYATGVERRLPIKNIGSEGQDGVEVDLGRMAGLHLGISPPAPGDVAPRRLDLKRYDCDDGTCAAFSTLTCLDVSNPGHKTQLQVTAPYASSSALYVEINGKLWPYSSTDSDGDGRPDLLSTSPGGGNEPSSLHYRRYSSTSESWTLACAQPFSMTTPKGPEVSSSVTVWTNRGVFATNGAYTRARIRLTATPPDVPVGGTVGVCSIAIDEPGVQLVPCKVPGDQDAIGGMAIADAWGAVQGACSVRSADDPCDGVTVVTEPTFKLTTGQPTIVNNEKGLLVAFRGIAVDLRGDEFAPSSERVGVGVSVTGQWGGGPAKSSVWDCTLSNGGGLPPSIDVADDLPGATRIWQVRSGGLVMHETAGVTKLTVDHLPTVVVAGGDLDGDGAPDLRCSSFPPGSHATIGGTTYPCDEVRIKITNNPVLTSLDGWSSRFTPRINSANQVSSVHVRLGVIPPVGATVDVPLETRVAVLLSGAAPNPFRLGTTMRLSLEKAGRVRVRIVDLAGREIARIAEGRMAAGQHLLRWDGSTNAGRLAPAGVYFVRADVDGTEPQAARVTRLQ